MTNQLINLITYDLIITDVWLRVPNYTNCKKEVVIMKGKQKVTFISFDKYKLEFISEAVDGSKTYKLVKRGKQ